MKTALQCNSMEFSKQYQRGNRQTQMHLQKSLKICVCTCVSVNVCMHSIAGSIVVYFPQLK